MTDARLVSAIRAATDVMRRATAIDLRLELAMDRFQRLLREQTLQRRYNPDWRLQPRTPRGEDGFGESMIEGNDNILGIPTLKHWLLNAWYRTPQEDLGGFTPREYLKGESWTERERVGRQGLIKVGVLKP